MLIIADGLGMRLGVVVRKNDVLWVRNVMSYLSQECHCPVILRQMWAGATGGGGGKREWYEVIYHAAQQCL